LDYKWSFACTESRISPLPRSQQAMDVSPCLGEE
jgi:hypothetical protein